MTARRWPVVFWAGGLGVLLLAGGGWWLFVRVCPTRDWSILRWSLERRTAATWNRPQIPALVAENALEIGGVVGRRFYRRALDVHGGLPWLTRPTPYGKAHLDRAWLETTTLSWSAKRFTKNAVLVKVVVTAMLPHSVAYGRSCRLMEPMLSLVERDYVTVPTRRGWRVAQVSTIFGGNLMQAVTAPTVWSASAILAGC